MREELVKHKYKATVVNIFILFAIIGKTKLMSFVEDETYLSTVIL